MPKNKAINLLPQEEFNASTAGRVLRWATSTFRIIVIVTEMVVMGAFLSRFWLDAQNSDLNNSIKVKSAQISSQADFEKKFREIQAKLNIFDKISQDQDTSKVIEKIADNVPENIILSRISLTKGAVEIRGSSFSDFSIVQFINNLQSDPFKKVELGQVSSSEINSGETVFVINITY
ncbi:MAG: hypothetical protein ACD_13C00015G0018 [uncultured bacterium]|uniref:Fimbrial assembly family protein n=1 Tax=Candidatus Woesebacteria bacterium GW2011_GWA1_40_43 TaxID=1618553 RepID=A0A0G0SH00_9BACT|nr:MAG: hypothetical protein ACD_13C00015G0018 [uncultured bacterium]KKR52467.1 MAG: hypothetical protein UT88_C0023G0018 [Candidatus Woesebacteria bacterium GW2011_GWD2_40_19]KKR57023.1 MAG: hypothetical protein UT96_C0028G0003 [Candidatus Woesebacteria bacterium GW2011_GWC2_40_30]KKR64123.1 MAG: hypothetical protein UU02_C0012G0002 [Candidatus Woesebacteria bacterium GW2011_GWA1_40_43]HAU65077.1 hypothetical protein [Candidatus Woesebacteria bacterium]